MWEPRRLDVFIKEREGEDEETDGNGKR
jgi:hypothetical protein